MILVFFDKHRNCRVFEGPEGKTAVELYENWVENKIGKRPQVNNQEDVFEFYWWWTQYDKLSFEDFKFDMNLMERTHTIASIEGFLKKP